MTIRYKERIEYYYLILKICSYTPVTLWQLMRIMGVVNHSFFMKVFDPLVKHKFLEKNEGGDNSNNYNTTEKGKRVIETMEKLNKQILELQSDGFVYDIEYIPVKEEIRQNKKVYENIPTIIKKGKFILKKKGEK